MKQKILATFFSFRFWTHDPSKKFSGYPVITARKCPFSAPFNCLNNDHLLEQTDAHFYAWNNKVHSKSHHFIGIYSSPLILQIWISKSLFRSPLFSLIARLATRRRLLGRTYRKPQTETENCRNVLLGQSDDCSWAKHTVFPSLFYCWILFLWFSLGPTGCANFPNTGEKEQLVFYTFAPITNFPPI